jgi:hypothetical protein
MRRWEGVHVVCVHGVVVWSGCMVCVFLAGKDEEGGAWGVGGGGAGSGDGVFHGTAHALMVVLWISHDGVVPF